MSTWADKSWIWLCVVSRRSRACVTRCGKASSSLVSTAMPSIWVRWSESEGAEEKVGREEVEREAVRPLRITSTHLTSKHIINIVQPIPTYLRSWTAPGPAHSTAKQQLNSSY